VINGLNQATAHPIFHQFVQTLRQECKTWTFKYEDSNIVHLDYKHFIPGIASSVAEPALPLGIGNRARGRSRSRSRSRRHAVVVAGNGGRLRVAAPAVVVAGNEGRLRDTAPAVVVVKSGSRLRDTAPRVVAVKSGSRLRDTAPPVVVVGRRGRLRVAAPTATPVAGASPVEQVSEKPAKRGQNCVGRLGRKDDGGKTRGGFDRDHLGCVGGRANLKVSLSLRSP